MELRKNSVDMARNIGSDAYLAHSNQLKARGKSVKVPEFLVAPCKRIAELHDEIQDFIESLEKKIEAAIEKEESIMLTAYKTHLTRIQCELLVYKGKLDDKECRLRRESIVVCLKESLNFFRRETGKLAEIVAAQKSEIARLKVEFDVLKSERTFLETQLKKAKKDRKILQAAIKKAEKELSVMKNVRDNKASSSIDACSSPIKSLSRSSSLPAKFFEFMTHLRSTNFSRDQMIKQCEQFYQELILRHNEVVTSLKQQIVNERRSAGRLKAAQAECTASRAELEQLFYECAEETRRYAAGRRSQLPSVAKSLSSKSCQLASNSQALLSADKIQIIKKFMLNDRLLKELYKAVFMNDDGKKVFELPEQKELGSHRRSVTCNTRSARYKVKAGKLCINPCAK